MAVERNEGGDVSLRVPMVVEGGDNGLEVLVLGVLVVVIKKKKKMKVVMVALKS